jgi:hypothetical protein
MITNNHAGAIRHLAERPSVILNEVKDLARVSARLNSGGFCHSGRLDVDGGKEKGAWHSMGPFIFRKGNRAVSL